jgi:hypothetical protein
MMLALAAVLASSTTATEPATQTQLWQQFLAPPRRYAIWQIIHNFDTTAEGRAQQVATLAERGFAGIVGNVNFHNYLRDEQHWQEFADGLRLTEEAGLGFWLYDEEGYPSGAAGGLTLEQNPDYEALGLARVEVPEVADATALGGKVWLVEEGTEGKRVAYVEQRMYEGTHCTGNVYQKRRYLNILRPEAVRAFLRLTHGEYERRFPKQMGGVIWSTFTDEPSLMAFYLAGGEYAPVVPWRADLPKVFRQRKGYDLVPNLRVLFGEQAENAAQVRCDFWELISDLCAEAYFAQIERWCAKRGIQSSGHALLEENLWGQVVSDGHTLKCLKEMALPGLDLLSSRPEEWNEREAIPPPKLVSSAAHLAGRKQVMSETSDYVERNAKVQIGWEHLRGTINWQYVLGTNLITSYYSWDPSYFSWAPGSGAGLEEYSTQTLREFNEYVATLGAMLTPGAHACDVAVLYPAYAGWAHFAPSGESIYKRNFPPAFMRVSDTLDAVTGRLLSSQWDFDYVDDESIWSARLQGGALGIGEERYRLVVLPAADILHARTVRKLARFARSGGKVVCVGGPPEEVVSATSGRRDLAALADLRKRAMRTTVAGLPRALASLVEPDLRLTSANPAILFCHRRVRGTDLYFLVNNAEQPAECRARIRGQQAGEVWDPLRLRREEIRAQRGSFALRLGPFEGVFLIFGT